MTKTHSRRFPRPIALFRHLQGGQYGTAELLAITDDVLELQLGADYVRFTREQAERLRDAVQKFLCLENEEEERRERRPGERREEREEEIAEEVVEERVERVPRSDRSPPSDRPSERPPPSEPPRRRKKTRAMS